MEGYIDFLEYVEKVYELGVFLVVIGFIIICL